ncbi:MAG: hypothetical protein ACK4ZM_00250, partial [bacterium]
MKKIFLRFGWIFLLCILAYGNDFYAIYKNEINKLIGIAILYNPDLKNFDVSHLNQRIQAAKELYKNSRMYEISFALPFDNFFPYKREMMSGYSFSYGFSNLNKIKTENTFNLEYSRSKIFNIDKETYLLDLAFNIRKNLITIFFDDIKLKILESFKNLISKAVDLAYTKYSYSYGDLSEISFANSVVQDINSTILQTQDNINLSNFEIYNLLKVFLPVQNTQDFKLNDLMGFYKNYELANINIYNNPRLKRIEKEKELARLEIYVEKYKYLPDNGWMVEYMARPGNPSMVYLKYYFNFSDKRQLQPSLDNINLKIKYFDNQKFSLLVSLEARKNYLKQRFINLK